MLTCKQTTYCIPRSEVEHATGFSWLSPQTDGTLYHNVRGTFAFISFDALRTLQQTASFVYDDITWRLIAKDETTLRVRADIDGTEMLIAVPPPYGGGQGRGSSSLPLVLEMHNNPLGIDWTLTLKHSAQQ